MCRSILFVNFDVEGTYHLLCKRDEILLETFFCLLIFLSRKSTVNSNVYTSICVLFQHATFSIRCFSESKVIERQV